MGKFFSRLWAEIMPAAPGTARSASNSQIISRLVTEHAIRYRARYGVAFFCMAIASLCTGLSAWIMEDVINEIFVRRRMDTVLLISLSVGAIFFIKGLATYGQSTILAKVGNNIVAILQNQIFDSILAQSLRFIQRRQPGDFVIRTVNCARAARNVLDLLLVRFGRDFMTLVVLIGVMISKDFLMTVIALLASPFAINLIIKINARIRGLASAELRSNAQVVAAIQETRSGVDIIKAFTLEPHMRTRAGDAIRGIEIRNNKIARLQAQASPIMETFGGISFATVIFYGGYIVIHENRDPGSFFAFLTALLLAYEPAKNLSKMRVQLERLLLNTRMMFELLDEQPEITDIAGAPDLKVTRGRVELSDVGFTYPGTKTPVLQGLNFEARPGEVTALVGLSGAGKTTIFSLIERFYLANSGAVQIDGQELVEVTENSIRNQIGLVTQEAFLFDGSVRDNLQLGREGATRQEIEDAARAGHAHEFIKNLPNGYDTQIGERGVALSGGQRQRLAITRALLRDAPILLLDEPTSSLDAQSEAHVQAGLDALMKGRTSIVIAHRLATVRNADVIHVMENGRIVQSGDHKKLLAAGGTYARLHELQFAGTTSEPVKEQQLSTLDA